MESQPQNPEFRINPANFHTFILKMNTWGGDLDNFQDILQYNKTRGSTMPQNTDAIERINLATNLDGQMLPKQHSQLCWEINVLLPIPTTISSNFIIY